jgi:hypothetical protein
MFNFLRRPNRQPVASITNAPVAIAVDALPRVILDDYVPYVPFTDTVTEQNVEEALAALIVEIGQSGYKASAAIDAIKTPQKRVNLIMKAMIYMEYGEGNGFSKPKTTEVKEYSDEDIDAEWEDDEDEDEEMEVTFASLKAFLLERKGVTITPQEYLDANRFNFSV